MIMIINITIETSLFTQPQHGWEYEQWREFTAWKVEERKAEVWKREIRRAPTKFSSSIDYVDVDKLIWSDLTSPISKTSVDIL